MTCDTCGDPAEYLVFSAYPAPNWRDPLIHPTFSRSSVARHRVCGQHLDYVMHSDMGEGDYRWLVEAII